YKRTYSSQTALSLRIRYYSSVFQDTVSSSSTAIVPPEIPTFQQTLNIDKPLVILPQPSQLKDDGKILPHVFSENLAVLYACLKLGQIERAKRILEYLESKGPMDMKHLLDVNLHNAFIEAFLDAPVPELNLAFTWLDRMCDKCHVNPNLVTFSILVKGYLRKSEDFQCTTMLQVIVCEMEDKGFRFEQLIESNLLSDDDTQKLFELLNSDKESGLSKRLLKQLEGETIPLTTEPIPTKAIGVKLMKNSLEALKEKGLDEYDRQIKLEENALHGAIERWKHDYEQMRKRGDAFAGVPSLRRAMWNWHEKLVPLIESELKKTISKKIEEDDECIDSQTGTFLRLLSADKLSAITILEMLRRTSDSEVVEGMTTTAAIMAIGKSVESEYNAEQLIKKQNRKLFYKDLNIHELFASGKLFNMEIRRFARKIEKEDIETSWKPDWGSTIRVKAPAFFHSYEYNRGKKVGVIKLNPQLIKWLSNESIRDHLHPRMLPMLIIPRPWLTFNSGGYLTSPTLAMRIKDCPEQVAYLKKASDNSHLEHVFAGLDVLGSTCWSVNKKVYEIVLKIWNSGEGVLDIPPADLNMEIPKKPDDFDNNVKSRIEWAKTCRDINNKIRNNHSLRCMVNYKVEIAGAYLDEPMYFPHSLDFRGRAYPIPSYLNHMGDDLCRGFLVFKDKKPLGKTGLKWLKIHLANLYGNDKVSFEEREAFADENIAEIMDSADYPLKGKRWWQKAEDPWQCLAACIELTEAIRSPFPEEYQSQIPVHQDGTCNGLQHYAALGGDLEGASQVNLAPSDSPSDIYSAVAKRVKELIKIDADMGDEKALLLYDHITRKVVKQTVMTTVYGVTFVGARLQIEAQLEENECIPQDRLHELSHYVAKLVFTGLEEIFKGAKSIQEWLNESARRIAKSVPPERVLKSAEEIKDENDNLSEIKVSDHQKKYLKKSIVKIPPNRSSSDQMTAVVWTTPLDLPIVQPYRRPNKRQIKTHLQSINIVDSETPSPVNSIKQRAAFPPNFIHSLDATHMLMTALACKEKGLTFASVHDSYWSHACDVETMNNIIREQFFQLHNQPIMENLRNEFIERYKGYKVPVKVLRKDLVKLKLGKSDNSKTIPPIVIMDNEYEDTLNLDDLTKIAQKPPEEGERELKLNEKKQSSKHVHIWVDLTFPELPSRGTFDIELVKNSQYFFN
ncbi:9865_t:CDS:2, partial [Scutellospora calospora]